MKRNLKHLLSACLALTMLAGCGGQGGQGGQSGQDSQSSQSGQSVQSPSGSQSPSAPVESGSGSGEVIELRWLSSQIGEQSEAAWFAETVDGFNKEYEGRIHINVDGVAGEAITEKLNTDAATDTMPDLFMLNADAARFAQIANSGKAADIMPYMEQNSELWDRVDKDSAATYTDSEGHLLGLPYGKNYLGIYYNKELFTQAGISEFPTTWDDFFAACDKLKAINVTPIALMTGENSWTTMLTLSHLIGTEPGGTEWLKYTPETVKFNEPAFVSAAEKLQKMLAEYTSSDAIGATYAVCANNFLNGKAAMIANGPWMTGDFSNPEVALEGLDQQVGYALAPLGGVIQAENIAYGIGSKTPEKIEASFEVLKYLARPEVYAGFLNASSNSPCIDLDTSLLSMSSIITDFLPDAMASETRYGQFSNCVNAAVNDGLAQLLPDLASGAISPEEFADGLQSISDKN